MSSAILRFQKTDNSKETDDTVYAYKNYDGSIDVVMKSSTNKSDTVYTFSVGDFYAYLDTLYDVFVADEANMEGSEMCSLQADIPGFPSFMIHQNHFYSRVDALNAAIDFWVHA